MDEELKQQLEWMNQNLMTIAQNQSNLYCQLENIRDILDKDNQTPNT